LALNSNQKLFEQCENVWDSPAQWAVMRVIVDSEDERFGYAYPSRNKMARLFGRDRRLVLRVIEELELKEAIQRLGVDAHKGSRNRYVVTLGRAIEKARAEAGVGPNVPLWKWPPRAVVRKSLADGRGTGTPPGETVSHAQPVEKSARVGSADPRGRGTGTPPPGAPVPPLIFSVDPSLDLHDVAAPATAVAAAPTDQSLPGLLHGDRKAAIREQLKAAAARRRSRLCARVAEKAREVLRSDVGAQLALNNGRPLVELKDLIHATAALCRLKRVKGYGDVLAGMCASEWFKFRNPKVLAGTDPRPRERRRRR